MIIKKHEDKQHVYKTEQVFKNLGNFNTVLLLENALQIEFCESMRE